MDISLIRMFIAGPDVCLNGSPIVSPTTAALWASEPFPPRLPSSMYFLALSHAPPELAIMSEHNAGDDRASEESAEAVGPEYEPDD